MDQDAVTLLVAIIGVGLGLATLAWAVAHSMKSDLRQDIANVKADLSREATATRTETREDVKQLQDWVFGASREEPRDSDSPNGRAS